jgi:hypothetical protein
MCSASQLVSSHTPRRHSTTSSKPLSHPHTSFNSSSAAALPPLLPIMRLYQLASPALAGRAAVFGSKLSLPSNWRLLDAPVFDAPGLLSSTAGISSMPDKIAPPAALQAQSPAAAAVGSAGASPTRSIQAAAGGSKSRTALQQQQRAAARQCCVSIAVAVAEGVDALQQVPELARWVL